VTVIALHGATVTVGGWAAVGPWRERMAMHPWAKNIVRECSDWTAKDEVSRKKKKEKEKCTSRVSWHEKHSEMAHAAARGMARVVMRAQ
jgi:hypothetical protein